MLVSKQPFEVNTVIPKVDLREGSLAIVHKDEQMPMVRVLENPKTY